MVGHGVRDDARNRAPPLRRARFCSGRRPAAAPAPLRRVSDDVVTAGPILSRVWFGPVPGSP
ncbi:hypothetical protein F511_47656 [Dorcoceras hygrometricum]|uniref:Uncharacterized protein n=1 Tax=Dorcoceras hygrometricum TaxID=472368 RepID=A0A2Z6ZXN3_9LAMI|nr:hypothetical protein F511_47656 [Dorcoceras hygrometricum]